MTAVESNSLAQENPSLNRQLSEVCAFATFIMLSLVTVIYQKRSEMNVDYGVYLNNTEAESDWSLDFLATPRYPQIYN